MTVVNELSAPTAVPDYGWSSVEPEESHDYLHGYLKNLALAATAALEDHFTALWDGGHIKFWSQKTLCLLLQEFGFAQTAFHGAGRLPLLWKSRVLVASKPLRAP